MRVAAGELVAGQGGEADLVRPGGHDHLAGPDLAPHAVVVPVAEHPADRQRGELHILQYSLSVITRADERYRKLKTAHVRTFPQRTVLPSPQSIKLQLVAENRDLPNPATYFFSTDLDFPYEETMLPIAKRKLMLHLAEQGGMA